MKNPVVLLASLFILASCQPIMLKLYGIKDPDIENRKTILKKALKYDMDTSNIATVSSNEYLSLLSGEKSNKYRPSPYLIRA